MDPYTRKRCMCMAMRQAAILPSLPKQLSCSCSPHNIYLWSQYSKCIWHQTWRQHNITNISTFWCNWSLSTLYPQHILSLLTRHYFSSLLLEWPGWTLTTLGSRLCWCQFRGSCRATATLVRQWPYTLCMRTHNSSELDIIMCVVNEQHCILRLVACI